MNWNKIIGNTIVAFSTAAIAVNLVGQPQDAILAGFVAAALQACLAMGVSLQDEGQEDGTVTNKANNLVLF